MADNFKYSISINQFSAVKNGFELDIIDCALFDYIKDFIASPNIPKTIDNSKTYVLLKWDKIINDMPLLGIKSKNGIIKRLNILIKNQLIERHEDNMTKGQSLFCIGERYDDMIFFKELPFGYKPPYHETDDTLPQNIQSNEKLTDTLPLNEQKEGNTPTTEHNTPTTTEVAPYHHSSNNNTIINYNIKHNVYNSLKESENFEKKSEKMFLATKQIYLKRNLSGAPLFEENKKLFLKIDTLIFDTRCLPEVSVVDYSTEDNEILCKDFVSVSSAKLGIDIPNEIQLDAISKAVLSQILQSAPQLNWSEIHLAMDIALDVEQAHPLFDFVEELTFNGTQYNLLYFNKVLKRYMKFRNHLESMIQAMADGTKPYVKEQMGVKLDDEIKIGENSTKNKTPNDI